VFIFVKDIPQDVPGRNWLELLRQKLRQDADPERVLAQRVRGLRVKANLTQQEVAEQMTARGLPMVQSQIASIEAAKRPVRVNEAAALADVLGVDLQDLLVMPDPDSAYEQLRAAMTNVNLLLRERDKHRAEVAFAQDLIANTELRLEAAMQVVTRMILEHFPDAVVADPGPDEGNDQ
jgi:transcriptional regulator with XRE-family HTH domain